MVTRWTTKNLPTNFERSDSFAIETLLKPDDIEFTIYDLTVFNPEGQSTTLSFCSFNHKPPVPNEPKFNSMSKHLVDKAIDKLVKTYPPPEGMTYSEQVEYRSKIRIEKQKMQWGFYHLKSEKLEKNETNDGHAFVVQKNLLLWFWLCGKKIFDYYTIQTNKEISYGGGIVPKRAFIAQIFWIFDLSMHDTGALIEKILITIFHHQCQYELYYIDMGPDSIGTVTEQTPYGQDKYYWMTGKVDMTKNRRYFVNKMLRDVLYESINDGTQYLHFPVEMVDHIIKFISQEHVDFLYQFIETMNQDSDKKPKPIDERFTDLCIAHEPMPFFQSSKYDDIDKMDSYDSEMKQLIIARNMKLILFG